MPVARKTTTRGSVAASDQISPATVAFQTRARTIDHLGRGQIADAPTAVSELWKNAYDAYARSVALHIFDGETEVAAVVDDGTGMSATDFRERWLVIGTESKIDESEAKPAERFGLKARVRQGEKGIGRLSAAFLAPVSLVVAKKPRDKFAAVLVDWRLFENPFLLIEDIQLPIIEFDSAVELPNYLPAMAEILQTNFVTGKPITKKDSDPRLSRLLDGWKRFSAYERLQNVAPSTHDTLIAFWTDPLPILPRHLEEWPVYSGLGDHGTALFLVGVHHELAQWVRPGLKEDAERELVSENLRRTLSGFVDPYSADSPDLSYEVLLHIERRTRRVLASHDVFGYDDLLSLEHVVDGAFDDRGRFKGRTIAFGRDLGVQEFSPVRPPPGPGRDHVGPFRFCIGTFEQERDRSTHTEVQFDFLKEQASRYAGLSVYRDGLRVMPYGRPESDFFQLEERRGRHAGRYFFAHRRVFGRVAISRNTNPHLRDKAGREGLVENRSRREMQLLVEGLLVDFAHRFFGTDAPHRKEYLDELEKRKRAAREATEKVRGSQRTSLREFMKSNTKPLAAARRRVDELKSETIEVAKRRDRDGLTVLGSTYRQLQTEVQELKPPIPPRKLGNLEETYRAYRDGFDALSSQLEDLRGLITQSEAEIGSETPRNVATRRYEANVAAISSLLQGWSTRLTTRMDALRTEWTRTLAADAERYPEAARPYLQEKATAATLVSTLNLLDQRRAEIEEDLRSRYDGLLRALERLQEGIDLEGALSVIDDDRAELEDKLRDIYQVAQLGIAVEIIGHELETLDGEVRRNLGKLPTAAKATPAFKLAYEAHAALADKLRFLAPLKIAGYRNRERITGAEISDYIAEFFDRRLKDNRISFEATDSFRRIAFNDLRSRIYPVFVNLVNNSIYWLSFVNDRHIVLDFVDGLAIVADSGKGVDPDDVPRLFQLFFTRRSNGRGIGLFLARANLAVARQKIRYATADDPHILPGANFIIEFQGLQQ
jgi:signal transduction histidine kinase